MKVRVIKEGKWYFATIYRDITFGVISCSKIRPWALTKAIFKYAKKIILGE